MSLFFSVRPASDLYTLSHTTLFRSPRRPTWGSRSSRICPLTTSAISRPARSSSAPTMRSPPCARGSARSEEHTSELQSQSNPLYRLLLENKTELKSRLHFLRRLQLQ